MTDHSALIERLEAAMSRDGKPRGDHMIGAYAALAVSALESGDEDQAELASVYDAASRCIANETAMFDALSAVAAEAAAALRDQQDRREGMEEDLYQAVLVAYRRGAVEWTRLNYPQWFGAISSGREVCPLPSAPNQAKEAGE